MIESSKKRYITALVCKVINLICSVATAGFVPRALGVGNYGDFQFLKSAFGEFKGVSDFSISVALFDWSSKKQKSTLSVFLFLVWELFQIILLFLVIILSWLTDLNHYFWPNQDISLLMCMACVVALTSFETQLLSFADTKALSSRAQRLKLVGVLLLTLLVLKTYFDGSLNLDSYIKINWISSILVIFLTGLSLFKVRKCFLSSDLTYENFAAAKKYITKFASPLIIYTICAMLAAYFSRWLLNVISGREEYGVYALAFSWVQLILVFTIALRPIFWKDVSSDFEKNDVEKVASRYENISHVLFAINMYFAAFIFVQADFLTLSLAGNSFEGAIIPLMILSIYPALEAMKQCTSIVYFATERTKQYKNIGIISILITPLVFWVILAPSSAVIPGFHLGAEGFAWGIIGIHITIVYVLIFQNCKFFNISYKAFFMRQLIISVLSIFLAVLSKFSIGLQFSGLLLFLISGTVYSIGFGCMLWKFPEILGIDKSVVSDLFSKFKLKENR